MNLTWRILRYFRPFAGRILLALALLLVATVLNLLKPWPLKFVVDTILPSPQGGIHFPLGDAVWSFPSALAITCATLVGIHLLWGAVNLSANLHFDWGGASSPFARPN